jgi:cytochrome c oxidase cbb3-type subunit 3
MPTPSNYKSNKTKMKKFASRFLKLTSVLLLLFFSVANVAAQGTEQPETGFKLNVNTVLAFVVFLLFILIAVLGFTVRSSMDIYRKRKAGEKKDNAVGKTLLLILFFSMLAIPGMAQETPEVVISAKIDLSENTLLRNIMLFIIGLEVLTILFFVKWISFFTGIDELRRSKGKKGIFNIDFQKIWVKANKFKPIEEEASLDVGHSYDGIRELDNATPPWFTIAFIASIIFGIGYLWRYHVAESAPNQIQEYEMEVAQAKIKIAEHMKNQKDLVDENTVVMLSGADIDNGKILYANNCAVCHGNEGQGKVGPNLTDEYWLHGGRINDVFKVIKLGAIEKGMMSWKGVFSATEIAQISSYIKSIGGSKPAGAKEPQGELYKEEAPVPADSSAAKQVVAEVKK